MMTKIRQGALKKYFKVIVAFVFFIAIGLAVFFFYIEKEVNKDATVRMSNYVERQSEHFDSMIDAHFTFLDGAAEFLSRQKELLSKQNYEFIQSIYETSNFEGVAIVTSDGNCHYNNGSVSNVSDRKYFKEGMKGKRTISDPVNSRIDLESRVVISVPIIKKGKVAGLLSASYNLTTLSRMLFEDIYDGEGYCVISTVDGKAIALSVDDTDHVVLNEKNLFDFYEQFEYAGSKKKFEAVKDDFKNRRSSYIKLKKGFDDVRFLSYHPLTAGEWMLCYVVPAKKAREPYRFITRYEMMLSGTFLAAVLVLFLYIVKINLDNHRQLVKFANTDALTGLLNKHNTELRINEWLDNASQQKGFQVFMMMDVDKFKTINDTYGHIVGDEVLSKIGEKLRASFRENDVLGRIGGDEFVVFMENIDTKSSAIARVENMRRALSELTFATMDGSGITVSIGVAFAPEHGMNYEQLYVSADAALYETKRKGRNGITLFQEEHLEQTGENDEHRN